MKYRSPNVLYERQIIHVMRYLEGGPVHEKPKPHKCPENHRSLYTPCPICAALEFRPNPPARKEY